MENRSHKIFKNASYNFVGYSWAIVLSIFITPFIVFKLGVRDYGIFVFINTIISLMGLLDFGLSTSSIKHLTEYHAKGEENRLERFIYTMNFLFLLIGIIGLVIFLSTNYWLKHFFPEQAEIYTELTSLFALAGVLFFVNSISSVFNSIPQALQRFDISNKLSLIILTLSSLSVVTALYLGYRLQTIFLIQIIFAFVSLIIFMHIGHKLIPQAKLKFAWDRREAFNSYKFGLKVFLSNIAGSSLTYLDRLIIPIFLGPSQLTYYSLPGNISSKIPGVSNTLAGVIFPTTIQLNSLNDHERIARLYHRSFRLLFILSCAISFSIVFLAEPIMRTWLNQDFADQSSSVLIILALTNLFLAMLGPLANFLLALGKIKILILTNIFIALLNASLLFLLLPRYGINGAALAYLISTLPVIFIFYYTEKKFLSLDRRFIYYAKLLGKISLITVIMFLVDKFLITQAITNLTSLIFFGPTAVILYLILYKLFGFYEEDDWRDIRNFGQSIVKSLKLNRTEK